MRKMMGWGVAFVLVCGLATGCGSSKGSADDFAQLYNEAADVLKEVKDKKTAEEAKPKLVKVGEKLKASMDEAAKKNPAVTAPGGATYPEAEQKKFDAAFKRFMDESARVIKENPKEGMELMQAWSDAIGGKAPAK